MNETCSTPDRGYMGDRTRGASLGRGDRPGDLETAGPFNLRRVRLDSQGYDSGGAYWGHGGQLWEAFSDSGEFMTFRLYKGDETRSHIAEVMRRRFGSDWPWNGRVELPRRYQMDVSGWLDRAAAKRHVRATYPLAKFKRN